MALSPWAVAGEVADAILKAILTAPAGPDARPLPFARSGRCAWKGEPDPMGMLPRLSGASVVVQGDDTHAEYREAFARLDALCELGAGCVEPGKLAVIRATIARGLNAGVYNAPGGGLMCVEAERPTRGQVQAALAALAMQIGQHCEQDQLGALQAVVDAAGAKLTDPMPPLAPRKAAVPWLSIILVGAFGLLLWGTFR